MCYRIFAGACAEDSADRTFVHYNWNLHGHYFAETNAVQKVFLYITEYLQKHTQKIQLAKQQKSALDQPPHENSNPSLRPGQHPLVYLFGSSTNLVIPQS